VLAVLLALIALVLVGTHLGTVDDLGLDGAVQVVAGVVAGFLIGLVASVMGVAGGELLIPTIVLLYGIDVKVAGSLSLMVSLPTMIAAFARYSRDATFVVLRDHRRFVILMALGSVVGTVAGRLLAGVVPEGVLIPLLGALLLYSAVNVCATPHRRADSCRSALRRCGAAALCFPFLLDRERRRGVVSGGLAERGRALTPYERTKPAAIDWGMASLLDDLFSRRR
jgi:hypothetical protein